MLGNQDPPEGWPTPRLSPLRVVAAVLFTLLTPVLAVFSVSAAATGHVVHAVILAGAALLAAHLCGMFLSVLRRPRPATRPAGTGRTDAGEAGLAFPYARWPYYWLSGVLGLAALYAAAFAVVLARRGGLGCWIVAVLLTVFAVLVGWFVVIMLRLAPGGLVLTPTGIYHRSLLLEHFAPWETVVEVQAREGPSPWITVRTLPAEATRVVRHTGRLAFVEGQALPFMVVRAYWLGANATPAYESLSHYVAHAGERATL